MRPQTGKRPQVASNRLCKPLNGKKQNIRTAAETLPIRGSPSAAIENPMPLGGPVDLFSTSVFSGHGIFEESRKSAFWGDLRGLLSSSDLMSALKRRANFGRLSRFRYFRRSCCPIPTTRNIPRSHLLRLLASGVLKDSRRLLVARWRHSGSRCFASKLI